MNTLLSRRHFLRRTGTCSVLGGFTVLVASRAADTPAPPAFDFPLVDFHVHLDNSTIDAVLPLARERGVKFGIVEHAGTKENKYPIVLSNDAELEAYAASLEGKPVYRGVQAEWTDWLGCFSRPALAKLDYVLTDAMTFPGKTGERVKLWEADAPQRVDLGDPDRFMDRYVDWHVQIMATEPIEIMANLSWLPNVLLPDYDKLWTAERAGKVIAAAVKHRVALEISASYKLPRLAFLRQAKAAGAKFSFGSNGRYPNMGKLDYALGMARELGLTQADLWVPSTAGPKAAQAKA